MEDRQLPARVLKLDAAPVVDLSVNATSTEAALVGRVDDRRAREGDDRAASGASISPT